MKKCALGSRAYPYKISYKIQDHSREAGMIQWFRITEEGKKMAPYALWPALS